MNYSANVVKIQRFSTHDGPGVRTVVFFKGCPLRCEWCHNPETQLSMQQIFFHKNNCLNCSQCVSVCQTGAHYISDGGLHLFDSSKCIGCLKCADICPYGAIESVGKIMSVSSIISTVMRDYAFYGKSGGLTVSGGEPMFQPDACLELLSKAKEKEISTAIETSGFFNKKYLPVLTDCADYLLWDFKNGISEQHKKYTGVPNDLIIENLLSADKTARHIILRCIMVKNVNMFDSNLDKIANIYSKLKHCDGIELIPYHAYGGSKNEQLGKNDNGNLAWIPSKSDVLYAKNYLESKGCLLL